MHEKDTKLAEVRRWLVEPRTKVGWIDHQDGAWCLSSAFPPSVLIDLHRTPDAVPKRRDLILYAIALYLETVFIPGESEDDLTEDERALTIDFAREAWDEILRVDRKLGLSADFDLYVVPAMTGSG